MGAAINIQKLSKRYGGGQAHALKDLTLQVNAGEVYGFLGPNGAGKSTTIRTLMNFLQPTDGRATILDYDIVRDSVELKRHVGYLAGEIALYPRLTGRQLLNYMKALQPLKEPKYLEVLINTFEAQLDKPIETLSKGNRQKIGLIQAMMHQPSVLILDEPTSGLDPLMQAAFYETVRTAKQRDTAIFLSSHDLNEVRKMCDRIGFIRAGELVAENTIADLESVAAHDFEISFKDAAPLAELRKISGSEIEVINPRLVRVRIKGELTPLFKILAKHPVATLDQQELNLEDEFLQLYETDKETT